MFFSYKNKAVKALRRLEDLLFALKTKCSFENDKKKTSLRKNAKTTITQKNNAVYQAVHNASITSVCKIVLKRNPKVNSFFDVGCGKGKAICYVGLKFNKRISKLYGVEIDNVLFKAAKKNIKNCKLKAKLQNINAINLKLNVKNCIIFLFNPFGERILQNFLNKNIKNLKNNNNYIAYINNIHNKVFANYKVNQIYNKCKISIFEA